MCNSRLRSRTNRVCAECGNHCPKVFRIMFPNCGHSLVLCVQVSYSLEFFDVSDGAKPYQSKLRTIDKP